MIRLENLTKIFLTRGKRKIALYNITAEFPTGAAVGLLGRNGAGKSTLMSIVAGRLPPTSGRVLSTGSISFPIGYAGAFHPEMTGAQNTRFVARIYGVDTEELIEFVRDFAELGKHFHLPLRTYSSGMKSRLSFGVSMGIPFDYYLIDEVTAVGDSSFKAKSNALFLDRMKTAGSFYVTHSVNGVRRLCDMVAVLEGGRLTLYEDVEEGIAAHQANMGVT